ncbi:MAG: enoyl-CoA hydratase/isomerase family protein [Deltaproteobacteria bacterium]|nr:enoyl-CoA hydratase/isomerase family protein [Deltaproteobacteria bacterium]
MATIERTQSGHVATLTINRPDKLNALNAEVLAELRATLAGLVTESTTGDPGCATRAVVLTGAGKAFVAGADIAAMAAMTTTEAARFSEVGHALCAALEAAPFPVLAAVNGFALGGGLELALACDFILAADTAKVGLPEVTLGVIPGFGGTQRLARRIGLGRARELVYTGRMVTAEEALRLGLVNEVVPGAELLARATKVAEQIGAVGPLAVAAAKRAMLHGSEIALGPACELERQAFAGLFGTEDQRTGMAAFLAKQKATFAGK